MRNHETTAGDCVRSDRVSSITRSLRGSARTETRGPAIRLAKVSSALAITFVFTNDSLFAEIADQINGYSERYDILEKEQAQKAHVPHTVDPGNGNNRTRGSDDHSAGYEEHERYDESAYNTCFRSHIACDNQYRCSDLGKADDYRSRYKGRIT